MEKVPESSPREGSLLSGIRRKLHIIIFEADTVAGKAFDITLLCLIVISIVVVMLESVTSIRGQYGFELRVTEWVLTALFTVEYFLRIITVRRPLAYIFSFYGIIDLLAVLPTYLDPFFEGSVQQLLVIRALRLLRAFRVFKLVRYMGAAQTLSRALKASRYKISVFVGTIITVVVIIGSLMYLVEGPENGFTSIPRAIYWAVVTLTTVGYGDLTPRTPLGQTIAVLLMLLGYGIIAVPTGIVTAELTHAQAAETQTNRACPACSAEGHDGDAEFCKFCGGPLLR